MLRLASGLPVPAASAAALSYRSAKHAVQDDQITLHVTRDSPEHLISLSSDRAASRALCNMCSARAGSAVLTGTCVRTLDDEVGGRSDERAHAAELRDVGERDEQLAGRDLERARP